MENRRKDESRRMSQEQLTAALVILALRGLSKSEDRGAMFC